MIRFRDVLSQLDREHLRRILGGHEDRTEEGTKRRAQVKTILSEDTWLAEEALDPFKALSQSDRERMISDLVWRLTCHVEGSITKLPGVASFSIGNGFRVAEKKEGGRDTFCLIRAKMSARKP